MLSTAPAGRWLSSESSDLWSGCALPIAFRRDRIKQRIK
jgi:hypothetical protein